MKKHHLIAALIGYALAIVIPPTNLIGMFKSKAS